VVTARAVITNLLPRNLLPKKSCPVLQECQGFQKQHYQKSR
jgi:hypothetical protein